MQLHDPPVMVDTNPPLHQGVDVDLLDDDVLRVTALTASLVSIEVVLRRGHDPIGRPETVHGEDDLLHGLIARKIAAKHTKRVDVIA